MTNRRGARDRSLRADAVEVEQGGRPSSFDGNHTDNLVTWLICPPGLAPAEGDWEHLMKWIVRGHLAWAVFPTNLDDDHPELDYLGA